MLVFALLASLAAQTIAHLGRAGEGVHRSGRALNDALIAERFLAALAEEAVANDLVIGHVASSDETHQLRVVPELDRAGSRLEWWRSGDLFRSVSLSGTRFQAGLDEEGGGTTVWLEAQDGSGLRLSRRLRLTAPRDCRFSVTARICLPPEVN